MWPIFGKAISSGIQWEHFQVTQGHPEVTRGHPEVTRGHERSKIGFFLGRSCDLYLERKCHEESAGNIFRSLGVTQRSLGVTKGHERSKIVFFLGRSCELYLERKFHEESDGNIFRSLRVTKGKKIGFFQGRSCDLYFERKFYEESDRNIIYYNLYSTTGITMEDPKHAAIIMPLYNGSLHSYVTDSNKTMFLLQALKFMFQCSIGYEYLIQKNSMSDRFSIFHNNFFLVLHHDIGTKNILLDSNLVPKICDFGLASMTDNEFNDYYRLRDTRFLPIRNFSPERFDGRCSRASEVYSFCFDAVFLEGTKLLYKIWPTKWFLYMPIFISFESQQAFDFLNYWILVGDV